MKRTEIEQAASRYVDETLVNEWTADIFKHTGTARPIAVSDFCAGARWALRRVREELELKYAANDIPQMDEYLHICAGLGMAMGLCEVEG